MLLSFTACQLSAVLFCIICLLLAVTAYSDLRHQPCMSIAALNLLPTGRSRWSGTIQVTLTCNPGYDHPLNAPPMGHFMCRPYGGSWEPDFIPDCNPLVRPTNIVISLTIDVSRICTTLGDATISENKQTITFSGGKSIKVSNTCKTLQSKEDCTYIKADMSCKENDFKLRVTLTLAYTEPVNAVLVTNGTEGLLEEMAEQLQIPAGSSHKATVEGEGCTPGTIGTFDKTLGAVCRGCSLGHYLSVVDRTCLPCPPGHFADSPMSERCMVCPGLPPVQVVEAWANINATAAVRGTDISMCPVPNTGVGPIANVTKDAGHFPSTGRGTEVKVTLALALGCVLLLILSDVI